MSVTVSIGINGDKLTIKSIRFKKNKNEHTIESFARFTKKFQNSRPVFLLYIWYGCSYWNVQSLTSQLLLSSGKDMLRETLVTFDAEVINEISIWKAEVDGSNLLPCCTHELMINKMAGK